MNNYLKSILISILFLLTACTLGGKDTATPQSSTDEISATSTSLSAPQNLALNKVATASAQTLQELPGNAVDGNSDTIWNSGADPDQWIQIDLGVNATITSIRLTVSQYPAGDTIHQVWAGPDPGSLELLHQFRGFSNDGDILEFSPVVPPVNIRFVKIITTQSPSWVAWREIEVFGYESEVIPSQQPEMEVADVIYYNGQILTMEKGQPTAQAIAIKGDKILAVGNDAQVMAFNGDNTRLVDLDGLTLTPGFIDSHAHRIGDRWHFGDVSAEQMMAKALSQGWTSVHELFVTDQRLEELVNIANANAMPLRVSMYLTMNFDYGPTQWWQAYQPLQQFSPYLQIAGLKITLDREWGEQVFFSQDQFTQMVLQATQAGWQVATHSFSPTANQIVLNGYEAGLNGNDNDTLRLRLEHIGTMTDDQLDKMADLGIIGSVGLINAGSLPDDASFKLHIPASEVQHTARWRDLIETGVFLIGNTDDPWCCTDWRNGFTGPSYEATVIQAIYQGVTRTTFTGRDPELWQVAQSITVQEALEMLTINGAYAAHQEDVIGSLKPGKYADIVILSGNPLTTPVEQIPNIYVVMTMVGGEVKYCAPGQHDVCGANP